MARMTMNELEGLRRTTSGAVYVEFLIAFMPFFIFFLCLWQVSIFYTAKLMVDHAADSAARSAAVVMGEPNPLNGFPLGDINSASAERTELVTTAAELALTPLILDGTIVSVTVTFPSAPGSGGVLSSFVPLNRGAPSMMVTRVRAVMNCKIAFANLILCPNGDATTGTRFAANITSEAVFPYQGAAYQ